MPKVKKYNTEEMYNSHFQKLLRELMEKYNVKQEAIGSKIGVARQTISKYANGETIPDIYSAQKIVEYFNENFNLSYSIEYWLGKEEVYPNEEKKIIRFSNNSIEKLIEYQNNSRLFLTLEIIINQKNFLKQLSDYIVNANLNKIIDENDVYSDFITHWCHINNEPNDIEEKSFYKIISELGIVHNYAKTQIIEELRKNKEPLMEYIEEMMLNFCDFKVTNENIEIMTGMSLDEYYKEEAEFYEKKIEEIENTKEGKELIKAYKNYKIKRIDEKDECKRNRKK